jgi:GNAT superfamily N-acetyltransferase
MESIEGPRLLSANDDLSQFDCGVVALNDWLRVRALSNHLEGAARSYVQAEGPRVIGYYCLAASSIQHETVKGKIKRNMPDPIPALIVGRLAVDLKYQSQGHATSLLRHAIYTTKAIAQTVGVRVLFVHAKDEEAAGFYQRYGFEQSPTVNLLLMARVSV